MTRPMGPTFSVNNKAICNYWNLKNRCWPLDIIMLGILRNEKEYMFCAAGKRLL